MKICIVKSKRVPHDLLTPSDGGSINFIEILKAIENNSKYFITVITRNENDNFSFLETTIRNIKVVFLPFNYSSSNDVMIRDYEEGISFTNSLSEYLSINSFDILHTHHWTSGIGLQNIKSHWVHTPHLLAFAKYKYVDFVCPDYILEQEQIILNNCTKIIALSCAEKNDIIEKYKIKTEKIIVIPNGVSEIFFNTQLNANIDSNKFIISTVARITKQKRLDIIIQAIRNLIDSGFNVNLKIIGGDYYDDTYFRFIQEQIQKYKLETNIEIIGFISQEEINSIYQNSTIYVQSSYYESQGIAIIEAMATGLPIVTTHQDALNEYFVNGENGYFYNGENVQELTNKLETLLLNADLRNKISNQNIKKSTFFKWAITISKTLMVLNPNEKKYRNNELLKLAYKIGGEVSKSNNTKNVAIAGSIAKGNSWSGSDIDFLCICDTDKKEEFYSYSNINVNIHYINNLKANAILNSESIANRTELLFENYLSEYFWKAIPLYESDSLISSIIKLNESSRQTEEVKAILIKKYINQANTYLKKSKELIIEKYFIQATIELRSAILFLVIAFKIKKNWIVQGSKKRPEQFIKLCENQNDFNFYDFFINSNKLNIDISQILKFTNIRQELRIQYIDILLKDLEAETSNTAKRVFIENEIKHNENLDNYYLQNLYNGYEIGAIYHIRQISSFKTLLNKVHYIKTDNQEPIIDKIIGTIDKILFEKWIDVMGLSNVKKELKNTIPIIENYMEKYAEL
jgi:D-inositol-3-phosphate glycosyltransferase